MMRKPLGRAAAVALVLAAIAASPSAQAADPALAEALFKEGVTAVQKQDWKGACEAFTGSNDADPSPGVQINLGLCNEKQGKTATAWGWYSTAAGTADNRGQRDRAELARKEADRLAKSLHKLTIVLEDTTPGLVVTRDGVTLPPATLGREVPVDPGEHVIEASGKGKIAFRTTVSIAAGPGSDRIVIKPLANAPDETPAAGTGGAASSRDAGVKTSDGSGQRTAGYLVGAGGVVALIVAGTLQILTGSVRSKQEEAQAVLDKPTTTPTLQDGAPNPTYTDAQEKVSKNKSQADANQLGAIAVGVGGLALIGTGLVLVLTAPSGKTASAKPLPITPTFGQGFAGLATSFAF